MRFFVKSTLIAAIVGLSAVPAMAQIRCNFGQGHRIVLDWGTQLNSNQPVLIEGLLNAVSDSCINGSSVYSIKGFPGEYASKEHALEVFKYVQALRRHGFTSENVGDAMKYIETIEEAAGDPDGKNAPLITVDKAELAMIRWKKQLAAESAEKKDE